MTLALTDDERSIAANARGDGLGMAMRIVADAARLLGAPRLIPVASAHIDGALYHGDSGTLFAETLVRGGASVSIPATLNVGALDLHCGTRTRLSPHAYDMAKRLMLAHEDMGCQATWTCAPYQAGHRPATGTDVAWGESNAVVFCNSVLGARTNRYGDFLDICAAITGRAPDYGLHRPENRRATIQIDCSALPDRLIASDVAWPILGSWFGATIGSDIGVLTGLEAHATEDRLKAFGAAAASTGAVALFHIAGVTPEAHDLATACGQIPPDTVIHLTTDMLRGARSGLSTSRETRIDAIAIGSPHLSFAEFAALDRCLGDRRVAVPFYACTGRHAVRDLEAAGLRTSLENRGIRIVADTCVVVTPILDGFSGTLMTNSGKFAHYAPGNTGYATQYGSLADCVESAVTGTLVRDDALWM
jgi:predicted aconitase